MDLDQSKSRANGKDRSQFGLDWEIGMSSIWAGLSNMVYLLFIFNNFPRLAELESYLHSAFIFWVFTETRIAKAFSFE